ncbi:MAG: LLM class F420-dependent oxidoreductase [Myxococcota bacterium]
MQRGAIIGFDGDQDPGFIREAGALIEALGFDTLWVPEHVLFFPEYDAKYPYTDDGRLRGAPKGVMDPFATLTFLAATTSRIRLATGICIVPQRHPVYLAKAVADLDRLSGGRFDFGVGVGWQREEYEALGLPFEERGRRMDEALDAMKVLWTDDVSTFEGEFHSFRNAWAHPKPVQSPHPPILVGGESRAALRRVATHADGWFGFDLTPASCAAHLETLSKQLEQVGLGLADRRLLVSPTQDAKRSAAVAEFAALGVEQMVVPIGGRDLEGLRAHGERILDWLG